MRKVLFILSELADSDLDWIVDNGTQTSCPPGTLLIEEGKQIEVLYLVLDGELSVSLAALGNQEVARLRSGEILGELSFLDSRPPTATVTARTTSTVLCIPRSRLTEKLDSDTAFASRFYRALGVFLASRLRRSQQRLGYDNGKILDDETQHGDELDPELLDQVALAGARFEWMLKRLRQAPGDGPAGADESRDGG